MINKIRSVIDLADVIVGALMLYYRLVKPVANSYLVGHI